MKILVTIPNYGTKNDDYARRVIDEYRRMRHAHDVDIVVLSNLPKEWGADVEVRVGYPGNNPRHLPFVHKQVFAERAEDYDLFIYAEDDTLVTERNVEAWLRVNELLPDDQLAGFMRSETDETGEVFISTVHAHFSWDPTSVVTIEDHTFAHFRNDHAACFILTRQQLRAAIESGGFLVAPREGRYDLLETAATDPYTRCGFQKMICVSHLDDFILPHLPNVYLGKLGLRRSELDLQIEALCAIQQGRLPAATLFDTESKVLPAQWSKLYYEPPQPELAELIPAGAKSILSIGCGWGVTERRLAERGHRVVGIPLDAVIAESAKSRSVDIVYGDLDRARAELADRRFDVILLADVLHLLAEPQRVLVAFRSLLAPEGRFVLTVPNLDYLPFVRRRLLGERGYGGMAYETAGFHPTNLRGVRRWARQSALEIEEAIVPCNPRFRTADACTLGLATHRWGPRLLVRARLFRDSDA